MSSIKAITDGLVDVLNDISGLRVEGVPVDPNAFTEFPYAVITLDRVTPLELSMGATPMRMDFRVTVYINKAMTPEAYDTLYEFIDMSGTNSIDAAIEANNDLKLSDGDVQAALVNVENIGQHEVEVSSRLFAADFIIMVTRIG